MSSTPRARGGEARKVTVMAADEKAAVVEWMSRGWNVTRRRAHEVQTPVVGKAGKSRAMPVVTLHLTR